MWEPHAVYGDLSRELILRMTTIYQEAFPHFHDVDDRLQTGFFRHIAGMVYSCLFNVDEHNWLSEFLTGLNETQKANWARQVELCLRGAPDDRIALLWQQWMKGYWENRIQGIPCRLSANEAEEMLEWVFLVGPAFPEAVAMVVRGPCIEQKVGTVLHILEKHDAPESYPDAVLQLLSWLLEGQAGQWIVWRDMETLLFRLPRKRAFKPPLNYICQRLTSLGFVEAAELGRRIENQFQDE